MYWFIVFGHGVWDSCHLCFFLLCWSSMIFWCWPHFCILRCNSGSASCTQNVKGEISDSFSWILKNTQFYRWLLQTRVFQEGKICFSFSSPFAECSVIFAKISLNSAKNKKKQFHLFLSYRSHTMIELCRFRKTIKLDG